MGVPQLSSGWRLPPSQVRIRATHILLMGCTPSQVRAGAGYLQPADRGYPKVPPFQVSSQVGVGTVWYPRVPLVQVRSQVGMGEPHGTPCQHDGDTPSISMMAIPPPCQQGTPRPLPRSGQVGCPQSEQHREYLLCGGRYPSCVHTGGLSCVCVKFHFVSI